MVRKTGFQNFGRTKILINDVFQEPNLFFENSSFSWLEEDSGIRAWVIARGVIAYGLEQLLKSNPGLP